MKYSVYLLREPLGGKVRYVGCSSNVETRVKCHRHAGPCKKWLRDLARRGELPIVDVVAKENTMRAFEIEEELIAKYGSEPGLLNRYRPSPAFKEGHSVLVSFAEAEYRDLVRRSREKSMTPADYIRSRLSEPEKS